MKATTEAARDFEQTAQPVRRTDQWPVVRHPCRDGLGDMEWRRPAVDGIERTCIRCDTRFRYVKAKPRGGSDAPQGPRSHF